MRIPLLALTTHVLLGVAFAQAPDNPPRDLPTRTCGLHALAEGRFGGIVPGLQVVFDERGLECVPALGERAPRLLPWRFELESFGRGEALREVSASSPSARELELRYERDELVEIYAMRADGVKQSFVFDRLPTGSGDLVVRGRVTTELLAGSVGADGLRFELPEVGGVVLGAVIGIDADGDRVVGSMRYEGGMLEYGLPAEFVESARLPLVLDPLIGSSRYFDPTSTNDDDQPDLAWDASTSSWLVTWARRYSSTTRGILGLRVDADGAPLTGILILDGGAVESVSEPRVANIAGRDGFVVTWRSASGLKVRAVPTSGGLPTAITIYEGPTYGSPAIGGEASSSAGFSACMVTSIGGAVSMRMVLYQADATLVVGPATSVSSSSTSQFATAISRSGGSSGSWLIVWSRDAPDDNVWGRFANRSGGFDSAEFPITELVAPQQARNPEVDGDGVNFVVAYEGPGRSGSPLLDVYARSVMRRGGAAVLGLETAVAATGDGEDSAAVAWLGTSALVAYRHGTNVATPVVTTRVRSVHPFNCSECEGDFALLGASSVSQSPRIGTRSASGALTSAEAAIAWSGESLFRRRIYFQRYRAESGLVTNLGGGCGSGGQAVSGCSISPSRGSHQMTVLGAAPSAPVFCVLGFDELRYSCGSCRLIADPFTGIVAPAVTDANGDARWFAFIDFYMTGRQFTFQWISPGSSCFGGFDLSNALRVTIQ
ncbi:MAG: hypothetical protein IPN34_14225 [Planctomycetes bacterium]|nr:hypothetical protein [Planctomycetota bacterium]